MKKSKLVVGHLINDELSVKAVTLLKTFDWIKWLDSEDLVEFFAELFKLLTQISEDKKTQIHSLFFSPNGVKPL